MDDQDQSPPEGRRKRPTTNPIRVTPTETVHDQTSSLRARTDAPAVGARVEANLIIIAHPDEAMLGRRIRMEPGSQIEVGRSTSAEISLPDVLSVSRHHARLHYRGDVVTLEDLESTNGTYVNDRVVDGIEELQSGDRFQVGTVHFKFLREQDPEHAYHLAIYQLVTQDGLTEIFNRRKFTEEADREFSRASRYGRPLALILFDIDHFKAINDRFGHLCGDFVLKRIAGQVKEMLRPEQIVARIGGEEFAVLCPETDLEGAGALAERLRETVAAEPFEFAGVGVEVRCSFGVAALRPDLSSSEQLFALADRALYQSKRAGRNRTTLASELSDDAVPPVA